MTNDHFSNKGDLTYLIGTGFALGVVHVLTGPDHLSALATLSANVGNHYEAAVLGVRWGLGHSSGLLLVGTVLILLSESGQDSVTMPDYASHVFESIVGIFMLLLGAYGLRRAWLKRPKSYYNAIGNNTSSSTTNDDDSPNDKANNLPQPLHSHHRYHHEPDGLFRLGALEEGQDHPHHQNGMDDSDEDNHNPQPLQLYLDGDETPVCIPPLPIRGASNGEEGEEDQGGIVTCLSADGSEYEEAVVIEQEFLSTVSPSRFRNWINSLARRISTKTMAFLIGIVHGLAGPGGVLGVIPAVQLQNWKLASLYLACFCLSSTVTMGCFATMYGACSSKIAAGNGATASREFQIECFSAALSILVGITWLTLLAFGKLEDVFP